LRKSPARADPLAGNDDAGRELHNQITNVPKKRRLLPDDATPGEEAALKYFLRDDQKIGFAWWFFCLWCGDHKPAFSRQLKQLAARVGRPVTHVDGIQVALRFWELSMVDDPAFAEQWRTNRCGIVEPAPSEWRELGRRIREVAKEEWRTRAVTAEEKKRGEIWGEWFRLAAGKSFEEYIAEQGLSEDEVGTMFIWGIIIRDVVGMARAFAMWAAAPQDAKIMALADRACGA
jgi:hypothetical protein